MQADKIWRAALGELQLQVSKVNYDTWLKDTRGLYYNDGIFAVAVPTVFIAEWLKSRLHPVVCQVVSTLIGQKVEVSFQVQALDQAGKIKAGLMPDGGTSLKVLEPAASKTFAFNPKLTFNTFVSGDCSRLPYTAAIEIAANPGSVFNPFYIYGGTGTGKTHLLHAIGHAVRLLDLSAVYMSAEQFTNEFIVSIRNKIAEEFRYKFSNADVLLLDDIQFLSCKTQTQECIFHILNDFLADNKQVVITCDRPPRDIVSFNARLRSRLEGGLVADIYPPDHKTRLAILELRSTALSAYFDPSIYEFLATHFHHSVRELEGALIRLTTYARLEGNDIDINAARQLLADMISVSRESYGHYPAQSVIHAVADYYAISPEDITGKKRDLKTARARHIVMYLLRQQNHCNLAEIGQILGNRDHSTVIHGCEKISTQISADSQLSKSIEDIRTMLKSDKPH
ncbi:MAG: chromosomal replication initiator protein DnaA [Dehalococcoidia bacterium]|nr:chromosomal replication initiator protein DnaA [Dehalococcoidia bacterium]